MNPYEKVQEIENKIRTRVHVDLNFKNFEDQNCHQGQIDKIIQTEVSLLNSLIKDRILNEFYSWGPIEGLIQDASVTEIIVNGPWDICYEKNGRLICHDDHFSTTGSYESFVLRICQKAKVHYNLDRPMADGSLQDFRLHLISEELTRSFPVISLRRHPKNPWTLESLQSCSWCGDGELKVLKDLLSKKQNFLVVGATGSGKTSVLNACLQALESNERSVIIEDTSEIKCPNSVSTKLLTRKDANHSLADIDQAELLRQALRMRPDRIVMGEIRGTEAKDLLMALSTGHAGSFASLHATDAAQAVLRLEMLIQLGAPFWSLEAIRNLIFLALQKIIVVGRGADGSRKLLGIYSLSSREASGILIERVA